MFRRLLEDNFCCLSFYLLDEFLYEKAELLSFLECLLVGVVRRGDE